MMKAGIYIHIPFCKIKCMYCDFYSITKREKDIPEFIDMLIKEIYRTAQNYDERWNFDTIFFGGGTPTLLQPQQIEKILHALAVSFNISNVKEITIEANPGEAAKNKLADFHSLGINRLSIGFQSLEQDLLTFLSRIHTPKDCLNTYYNAQEVGFSNINIDMIFNIPNQSPKTWENNLKQVIALNPDHISCYSLTVEPNTLLHNKVLNGTITMPKENIDVTMFEFCQKYLTDKDYIQYEISNYAKKNKECQHNLHYWNLEPYLAFGPSAHGYNGHKRWWNTPSLKTYIQNIKNYKSPVIGSEILSQKDQYNEIIFNGLRTKSGIPLQKIKQKQIHFFESNYIYKKWGKYLNITSDHIKLKFDQYKYADEIASDLMLSDI